MGETAKMALLTVKVAEPCLSPREVYGKQTNKQKNIAFQNM